MVHINAVGFRLPEWTEWQPWLCHRRQMRIRQSPQYRVNTDNAFSLHKIGAPVDW